MKPNLNNEEGFTLMEALVTLMLSSFILVLLLGGILQIRVVKENLVSKAQNVQKPSNNIIGDRQIEWHLFLNQFEKYLQDTKNPQVSGIYMVVDEWDDESQKYVNVRYAQVVSNRYNFARVKNRGNHRMLSEMHSIHLEQEGTWLNIEVTFRNLETYSGRILVESWLEEEVENEEKE